MAVVVLAPNAFKGTIGPLAAAEALAAGWARIRPGDALRLVPMADGGDGTLEALGAAEAAAAESAAVPGPIGGVAQARWLRAVDGTAMLELAATGGLRMARRLPRAAAAPRGRGGHDRIRHGGAHRPAAGCRGAGARDRGQRVDGRGSRIPDGAGRAADSIGTGTRSRRGTRGLAALHRIDLAGLVPPPARGAVVLTDVTNPLLGPAGAAAVFGPQKGAAAEDVPVLEANLARFAARLAEVVPVEPERPGAGAAGGLGFGLAAWGARIVDGADEVATRVGTGRRARRGRRRSHRRGALRRPDRGRQGARARAGPRGGRRRPCAARRRPHRRADHRLGGCGGARRPRPGPAAARSRDPARWLAEAAATLAARFPD